MADLIFICNIQFRWLILSVNVQIPLNVRWMCFSTISRTKRACGVETGQAMTSHDRIRLFVLLVTFLLYLFYSPHFISRSTVIVWNHQATSWISLPSLFYSKFHGLYLLPTLTFCIRIVPLFLDCTSWKLYITFYCLCTFYLLQFLWVTNSYIYS